MDPIEAALWRCGIERSLATGVAAYEVATVLAENQLRLGHTVVADAVNSLEVARDMRRRAARREDSGMKIIEVACSDVDLHQSRLAGRTPNNDGLEEPMWSEVTDRVNEWETWTEERLLLDSVHPLSDNIERALAYAGR